MNKEFRFIAGAAAALLAAGCAETGSAPFADVGDAAAAFASVPAGFSSTSNSFDAAGDLGQAFHPHRDGAGMGDSVSRAHHGRHGGPGGRGMFSFLMGGGIGREFLGEIGFGHGRGRGPFRIDSVGSSCVFSSSTGVVTCGPIMRGGLAMLTTARVTTADGTAQPKVDSTTDRVVLASEVTGTKTRRDSAVSTIAHTSTRTITGLAHGSTQRTVDGTSIGTEKTIGTTESGTFEAIRTVSDTTGGVIIPLVDGRPTYPSAGRVSRNMTVTITANGATTARARSEVVTYDGTAVAQVVVTQDGTTRNCRLPLPRGRLACE